MPRHIAHLAVLIAACLVIPVDLHAEDAAEHVARAREYLDKRDYNKAIAECDKALERDSNSAEAYVARGRAWVGKEDCDRAIADCDRALAIDPKLAAAYGARGRAWFGKDNYDKALADCDKAIALDPQSVDGHIWRAGAWLEKGNYEKALADSNRALDLDPKSARAFYCRAQVFWRRGDYEKADSDFKRSLALRPDEWDALNNLGVLHWLLAQKQEAKAAAAEAAGDLETAKACRQESAALKSDAMAQWLHGVTANPVATDIHSNLGYAYSEANDLDKAEFHLRKAIEIKNIAPRAHNNLGRVLLRESQVREAQALEAEAKGKTDPAEAAKARRLKDEAKTKFKEAIGEFEKSAALDPTLLEAKLNLGEVYLQLGELDKAEAKYRAILSASGLDNANYGYAYFGLARIAVARKEPDEAVRHLQKAIERNPQDVAALQLLASQLYERGEYREGEKVLLSWLAKLPPEARPKVAEQLAKQLDGAGKHEAAAKARTAAKVPAENSPRP
jgi:tetratricopeptide (TPR) repeat protein